METFIRDLVLGLSLAAPIGPVNAAQLDRGMRGGFIPAWLFGLGAVTADLVYIALVYFGIGEWAKEPIVQTFLWLFGAFVLLYTGAESVWNAHAVTIRQERKTESAFGSWLAGFLLSLLNPLSILFWLGVYGSVLAQMAAAGGGEGQVIWRTATILVGVVLWDMALAAAAGGFRRHVTANVLAAASLLSGIALVGFGLYFGWQGVQSFWA
ncbi:LysE family translocator [Geobacillus subterraneus]|uniref:LysE family translocator n=1 Tax=Geobacillus subterraneus TaxID=129338 RepID=UPI00160D1199